MLTSIDGLTIEKLFAMERGYVLDFSNRTFRNFVHEHTGIDVYDKKYVVNGDSKANRLRTFLKLEPDVVTNKLLEALCEYWRMNKLTNFSAITPQEQSQYDRSLAVVAKLKRSNLTEDALAIMPNSDDASFAVLSAAVRELIEKDKPEEALDRLHTFTVRYMRTLCDQYGVDFVKDTSLNTLFGGYVKKVRTLGLIKTDMAQRILLTTIQIMSDFNSVRNNHSLAHPNPLLGYDESVLIFSNVSSVIRFVEHIEYTPPNE